MIVGGDGSRSRGASFRCWRWHQLGVGAALVPEVKLPGNLVAALPRRLAIDQGLGRCFLFDIRFSFDAVEVVAKYR